MGFFSDFKEQLATGGNIVTKTVEGTVANVGRLKIQTIDEMAAQGYNLVNEVSESIYYKRMFGETASGVRYTLTFKKDSAVAAREEQAKRENTERKKREEAQAERKWQEMFNSSEQMIEALGHGYCVLLENDGSAVTAIERFFDSENMTRQYKSKIKITAKILKKCGKLSALSDCGEKACKNLCKILKDLGAKAKVIPYEEVLYAEQQKAYEKEDPFADIFYDYMSYCTYDTADMRVEGDEDYVNNFYSSLID